MNAAGQSCRNCGLPSNYVNQSATDLPATVFGVPPPAPNQFQAQNQQNYVQNQSGQLPPNQQQLYQQQSYQPPMPPPQTSYSQPVAPKSQLKKILVIGGLFGFVVVVISGVVLWFAVINPYLKNQTRLKKEKDNQSRANMKTAISLLPSESIIYPGGPNSFKRNKTFDKLQLFQASQNLSPELKQQIKDINDAAAAEYVNEINSSQKFVVQIYKFNSPEQAYNNCVKITQELKKNEALIKSARNNTSDSDKPSACFYGVEFKNNEYTDVRSLYGFLWISSGHIAYTQHASAEVGIALMR